jgi:hypothetical protein
MTQMTSNEFEAVAWPQLVWSLTRSSITHLWRQASKWAATMPDDIRRSAQRQLDQTLPPPDLWQDQFRRDTLRIEARRIL